jgi:hypothetical protein
MICHRLRIPSRKLELFKTRLELIKIGYVVEANSLETWVDLSNEPIEKETPESVIK